MNQNFWTSLWSQPHPWGTNHQLRRIITLMLILCSFVFMLLQPSSSRAVAGDPTIPTLAAPNTLQSAPARNGTVFLPLISVPPALTNSKAVVFVSRQIPAMGTVYWNVPKGLPGVGPFSRFQVAAPGKLLMREAAIVNLR